MKSKSRDKDRPVNAKPLGAGHVSFDRVDSASLFKDLRLKKGSAFLDIACGRGAYTLAAAKLVGPDGPLYAVDLWKEGIAALTGEARARGVENVIAKVAEIRDMKTDIDMLTVLGRAEAQDDGSKFVEGVMTSDALFSMQEELTIAHKAGESAEGHQGYEPDALAEAYKERDAANLDDKLAVVKRRRIIKQAA